MEITSPNNPQVKYIKQLQLKKYRDREKCFVVEGEHLVLEAIKHQAVKKVYVLEGYDTSKLLCDFTTVSIDVMTKMSELKCAPSMLALCKHLEFSDKVTKNVLILDSVQDPSNVGALVRSAVAFGFDIIYINEQCADCYNSKVIRASQGAIFTIPIVLVDIKSVIQQLKAENFEVYTTSLKGSSLKNIKIENEKIALILGNEGKGVSHDVAALATSSIRIDIKDVESLNVAVAGSIIMYELSK